MTDKDFLELSNDTGLIATAVLTFNFLLGMLLSVQYKKNRLWNRIPQFIRQVNINNLHNYTAYVALFLVIIHPILLLFAPTTKFSLTDVLWPVNAPTQKLFVAFGTLAMAALIIVIVTTQKPIKKRIGFRTWKNIHLISYIMALLFVVHGVVMDPQLKNRDVDFFDGEKLVSELCGLVIIVATVLRYKYHIRKQT
ncbi:MAG TPA: ferric reductase-like transmembrane domain-containing protein [Puia sp.]|nr:ferric reductase-like transmembrane domain-containing protein [Puia sp.]